MTNNKNSQKVENTDSGQVLHGLPEKVIYCSKCVVNNQRPAATPEFVKRATADTKSTSFGEDGICDACKYNELKRSIDWDERRKWLEDLCDRHRSDDGSWDVIVPGSGGKDSIFVSHILKTQFGMNPLTVTWAPHAYTDVGRHNHDAWLKIGLDNFLVTPNPVVHAYLTRLAFLNLLNPFQPFILGQKMFAPKLAAKLGIKLIMYGENAGERTNSLAEAHKATMAPEHYSRESAETPVYLGGVSRQDLADQHDIPLGETHIYAPGVREDLERVGVEVHHMTTYVPWSTQRNFYYSKEVCDFKTNPHGRSEGTYSKYASLDDKLDGFHFYTRFIKFGQGRAADDACRDIRDGYMSREEAVALVKRYDGEFPKRNFEWFLGYVGIDEDTFWDAIDRNRSPHLWTKHGNDWQLRHPVS